MKKLIVITFLIIVGVVGYVTVKSRLALSPLNAAILQDMESRDRARIAAERADFELQEARLQVKIHSLVRWENARFYSVLAFFASLCISTVIVATGAYRKLSTHVLRLKTAEIPVKDKDLSRIAPEISLQLVLAEQLEAQAPERAFQMYCQLSDLNTRQIAALAGRRGLLTGNQTVNITGAEPVGMLPASTEIPAFREILTGLAPGDDMILGYKRDTGSPVSGTFDRIYSCGIFGLSGSGKTTGLYSIICQSLITFPNIRYFVIDPHQKRPEGLTAGLPKTEHFTYLDPHDFRQGLYLFNQALSRRLETKQDYGQSPLVLLIDELPLVVGASQGSSVQALLGRISKEGRKVAVYCLISGQDTRLKAAGADRDLLCSQIAYDLRKKQARYLFDDSEIVELHKVVRESKEKGLCVFAPTDDLPMVVKQPHCKPEDVQLVERIVKQANGEPISIPSCRSAQPVQSMNTVNTLEKQAEQSESQEILSIKTQLKQEMEKQGLSLNKTSQETGIAKSTLSNFLNSKGELSDNQFSALTDLLYPEKTGKIISFEQYRNRPNNNVNPCS